MTCIELDNKKTRAKSGPLRYSAIVFAMMWLSFLTQGCQGVRPINTAEFSSAYELARHGSGKDILGSPVQVVRTWGDLAKQPPIDAGDGVRVRLGISATHTPVNSGVVIYCLTDGYNFYERTDVSQGCLGPLEVAVRRGSDLLVPTNTYLVGGSHGFETTRGCTLLFGKAVLVDAPGGYEITVRTVSGRQLARVTVTSDTNFYQPWTPFVMEEDSKWAWVSYADYTFRQTMPAILGVPGVGIAINDWTGFHFQVYSGHANLGYDVRGMDFKPRKASSPLPSLMPDKPDPHLTLKVQDGFVEIASANAGERAGPDMWPPATISTRPDLRLLARWWINGKPFIPKTGHAVGFGGPIVFHNDTDKRLRFKLNLNLDKLGAHSGDYVALQLLLCDAWCYLENPNTDMDSFSDGKARLTNKVKFVLK